ncbi:TPA: virulence RhuM family protein [Candidatus Scatousia excrementigallinarum]|uniref:Virulence RhuM family protein n=1 Tax=Candidatus Scatousia excrementigallinarum TaxID=2840935 RepID=A0A9D1JN09_9BACT|nr:virulence RhuM family protein [Candidatus Scatousia excrementigallinarum]
MENEIIIYQTQDGQTKIDVRIENETVWLTQNQMAELFQTTKQNISLHIKNIFEEGELTEDSTVKDYLTVQNEGRRKVSRNVTHYNLDVIISVGYRVKSLRGTQFRIWATQVLKEYMKKGFALNDDLLKQAGGGGYWQELLERIRDIRSSEKVFYRQILDIYATSTDYNPNAKETKLFFKVVQNKMHFAAHGHTAAEVIYLRADSTKDNMGLTVFKGKHPKKDEVTVAKNYLDEKELNILNRITSAYLEFAELQAIRHIPMTMKDWIAKLDDFIKMTGSELLENPGKISKLEAENKALAEYAKYKETIKDELSEVEKHFLESVKQTQKQLEKKTKYEK